jgi:Tol biopolymer transport system component
MTRILAAALVLSLTAALVVAADPPKPLKPTPLPSNTDKDETDPHVSSDDLTLYYTVLGKGKTEIYVSQRKKANQPFPAGKPMVEMMTKTASNRGVFITPEGKFPQYLFYATDRDADKRQLKGDNFDLYFLIRQRADADWTTDTALITLGTEADEMHPWLSPDAKTIYFSRKTKEGWQLYTSTRPGFAQFPDATKVDFPPDFHHATLTPDGKAMVLQGPLPDRSDKKRLGLFLSTNPNGKGWSKPEPLSALNSPDAPTGDLAPNFSRDGSVLYFASDRPGGKGGLDLYMIPSSDVAKKK